MKLISIYLWLSVYTGVLNINIVMFVVVLRRNTGRSRVRTNRVAGTYKTQDLKGTVSRLRAELSLFY